MQYATAKQVKYYTVPLNVYRETSYQCFTCFSEKLPPPLESSISPLGTF